MSSAMGPSLGGSIGLSEGPPIPSEIAHRAALNPDGKRTVNGPADTGIDGSIGCPAGATTQGPIGEAICAPIDASQSPLVHPSCARRPHQETLARLPPPRLMPPDSGRVS